MSSGKKASSGECAATANGALNPPTTVVNSQGQPGQLTFASNDIFWGAIDGSSHFTIFRESLGDVQIKALAVSNVVPGGLVVDNGRVFWFGQDVESHDPYLGDILSVPMGGGIVSTLESGQRVTAMSTVAGRLIWAGFGASESGMNIYESDELGGQPVVIAAGANGPYVQNALAGNADGVFWSTADGRLMKWDGSAEPMSVASAGVADFIALGDNTIVWSEISRINAMDLGSKEMYTVVESSTRTPVSYPRFVITPASLYWTTTVGNVQRGIYRVSLCGGTPDVIDSSVEVGGISQTATGACWSAPAEGMIWCADD